MVQRGNCRSDQQNRNRPCQEKKKRKKATGWWGLGDFSFSMVD